MRNAVNIDENSRLEAWLTWLVGYNCPYEPTVAVDIGGKHTALLYMKQTAQNLLPSTDTVAGEYTGVYDRLVKAIESVWQKDKVTSIALHRRAP